MPTRPPPGVVAGEGVGTGPGTRGVMSDSPEMARAADKLTGDAGGARRGNSSSSSGDSQGGDVVYMTDVPESDLPHAIDPLSQQGAEDESARVIRPKAFQGDVGAEAGPEDTAGSMADERAALRNASRKANPTGTRRLHTAAGLRVPAASDTVSTRGGSMSAAASPSGDSSQGGIQEPVDALIMKDHAIIKLLYREFETAPDDDTKKKKLHALIYEMARHSAQEEIVVYGFVGRSGSIPGGRQLADESQAEHQELKRQLKSVDSNAAKFKEPEFQAMLRKTIDTFVKHADEEENSKLLPVLRKYSNQQELHELGRKYWDLAAVVTTRPHPLAPTGGATAVSAHMGTKPLDLARDWMEGRTEAMQVARDAEQRVKTAHEASKK